MKRPKRDKQRTHKHICEACGRFCGFSHIHHIFGGAYRSISEKEDFVIELCPECHSKAHNDAEFANTLKRDCELEYLEEHTMEDWMNLMGKNWILEDEVYKTRIIERPINGTQLTAEDFEDYEEERRVI